MFYSCNFNILNNLQGAKFRNQFLNLTLISNSWKRFKITFLVTKKFLNINISLILDKIIF